MSTDGETPAGDSVEAADETLLTANIIKRGVRYPVGTPISLLPEDVVAGLTAMSVDGPLPHQPVEPPKPRRRRQPKAPKEIDGEPDNG